ncbi:MAG: urease accessory protein [Saprospiraceae bacterium]|nr:urease accessory protein [Saprospiraceae bacterium]
MDIQASFPWLFAAIVGFGHAFEADHLLAVSNIVTKRKSVSLAIKDGIFWGLGHTSTIFFFGFLVIVGRVTFLDGCFGYLEAFVGLMLITLGLVRLYQYFRKRNLHFVEVHKHHLAYGVGLIHGLAGSGAMILLVMTEVETGVDSLIYLVIFGIGSIVGMLIAAGLLNLPFSRKIGNNANLQLILVVLSSLLCLFYGGFIIYKNLQ